jgi:hypothetical protein
MAYLKYFISVIFYSTVFFIGGANGAEKFYRIYVNQQSANLFSSPDSRSNVIWKFPIGTALNVRATEINTSSDWLFAYGYKSRRLVKKDNGGRPDGWLARGDVVLDKDFREVIACWPIKSILLKDEGSSKVISFTREGEARVTEKDLIDGGSFYYESRVAIAGNFIRFKFTQANNNDGVPSQFVLGYRAADRAAFPIFKSDQLEQKLFAAEELQKCEAGPITK